MEGSVPPQPSLGRGAVNVVGPGILRGEGGSMFDAGAEAGAAVAALLVQVRCCQAAWTTEAAEAEGCRTAGDACAESEKPEGYRGAGATWAVESAEAEGCRTAEAV